MRFGELHAIDAAAFRTNDDRRVGASSVGSSCLASRWGDGRAGAGSGDGGYVWCSGDGDCDYGSGDCHCHCHCTHSAVRLVLLAELHIAVNSAGRTPQRLIKMSFIRHLVILATKENNFHFPLRTSTTAPWVIAGVKKVDMTQRLHKCQCLNGYVENETKAFLKILSIFPDFTCSETSQSGGWISPPPLKW